MKTTRRTSRDWLAVGMALMVAACAREMPDVEGADTDVRATTATAMDAESALPDTTAAAVWDYLDQVGYRDAWTLWPGKGELYAGAEPHGMLLTTYLDTMALAALESGASAMPAGAFLVKENYTPDSTLAAVTAMYKVEGYNPDHGDWFFAKYQPDGTVEAAGRAEGCQTCHLAGTDYIMTPGFGSPSNDSN